jgi:hypothetical protein
MPAASLGAGNCGTQLPDGAIVHRDGTITDAQGHVLSGNIVCSYADVANGVTSNGSATNTHTAVGNGVQTQASIQHVTPLMVEESFQLVPAGLEAAGWYSITMAIEVPTFPFGNIPQPQTIRFFSGILDSSNDRNFIAGTLQYQNGQFAAYAMQETVMGDAGGAAFNVYSQHVDVSPGDTIIVTVQQAGAYQSWNASVTNLRTGAGHTINVPGNNMVWAIPGAFDAIDQGGVPLSSCSQLPPSFNSVHFSSPALVLESGEWGFPVGGNQPFNPGIFNNAIGDGQPPSCNWGNFGQNDNGNQSGYTDLIWNCNPVTCNGGNATCGLYPVTCTNDYTNCGGCPQGQMCSTSAGNRCVTACTPKTCGYYAAVCGSISDGCGGTLNCGTCTGARATCGGGVCSCFPLSCQQAGQACGTLDDGCGNRLVCGPACPRVADAPSVPRNGVAILSLLLGGLGFTMVARSKRSRSPEVS